MFQGCTSSVASSCLYSNNDYCNAKSQLSFPAGINREYFFYISGVDDSVCGTFEVEITAGMSCFNCTCVMHFLADTTLHQTCTDAIEISVLPFAASAESTNATAVADACYDTTMPGELFGISKSITGQACGTRSLVTVLVHLF